MDRSWGYNPASFFAPESSYGSPCNLRHFVDAAHRHGLAVIFDVVYNHAGPDDNVLWEFDGYANDGGIYFEGGQTTDWGRGPGLVEAGGAGLLLPERPDVPRGVPGRRAPLRRDHPDQRRAPADRRGPAPGATSPTSTSSPSTCPTTRGSSTTGRFAPPGPPTPITRCQRALAGQDPLNKVKGFLGWDGYDHAWNLVKYTLGSHDDIGDQKNGNAEDGLTNWDKRHRYLVDQLGGRDDWAARAKCRLAWALNVAMPGTPHDVHGFGVPPGLAARGLGLLARRLRRHGDHRFNWTIAGDPAGHGDAPARRRVQRGPLGRTPRCAPTPWTSPHEDHDNQVLGVRP